MDDKIEENRQKLESSGLFLSDTRPVTLLPYLLIFIGMIVSVFVVAFHMVSFKEHLHQAEDKIENHIQQLQFTEKFDVLDQSLTVIAMAAMNSRNRELLATYLAHKEELDKHINDYLNELEKDGDLKAKQIVIELARTNRDLIQIEQKYFHDDKKSYILSPSYIEAKERIKNNIRLLNERIASKNGSPQHSLYHLNKEFEQRNAQVVFGLVVFWLTLISWSYWIYQDQRAMLKTSNNQRSILDTLVQRMKNGVVVTDKNGDVLLWNHSAQQIVKNDLDQLRELAKKNELEVKAGNTIYELTKLKLDNDGEKSRELMLIEDITEKHRSQKELDYQRQKQAHVAKMATLGEVSGNLAHEINTPLATIKLSLEGIKSSMQKDDEELSFKYIHLISQAVKRMSSVVEAFRRYSRLDDSIEQSEMTDVREIVNDALEICEPDLKSRSIKIHKKFCPNAILADCRPASLTQAIINLISNARDAIKNQKEAWISIDLRLENNHVVFVVQDSGHGVEASLKDKVFDPFFTTKPRGEGSGIGLGIVRDIARAHQGDISHGLLDGHTYFELRIPAINEAKAS